MNEWVGAACRDAIASGDARRAWWFPEHGDSVAGRKAKAVCAACPIKGDCLAHAMTYMETGIWGGTNDRERSRLRGPTTERACSECETAFVTQRGAAGSVTCSDLCRSARHARQKRERRDAESSRAMYDVGHGTISRYQSGCHCPACRRASREYRARFRVAVA